MLKRYWARGLGLVLLTAAGMLVGGLLLAGIGSHSALAQMGTTAPATTATAATPALNVATAPDTLRDRIIDMMKDHMGLTDQQAGDWADVMTGHMLGVYGDWTGIMLDQMDQYMDQYVYGYGMMNGITSGTMMGGIGGQSGVNSTTGNYGTPGSMMNGFIPGSSSAPGTSTMMGGTTATTAAGSAGSATTSTTQSSATARGPQAPGTMMNGTTGTATQGTISGMMGGGGMGSRR